jgi:radial spoke head protein 1
MIGSWVNDVRQGQGKYTYLNGDTYEGEWDNNLRHGYGTYTYTQTGAKYVGQWINGRREGTGELLFNGYSYRGNFLADQPHGGGKYTFDFGVQQLGDYILEKPGKDNEEEDDGEDESVKLIPRWLGGQVSVV